MRVWEVGDNRAIPSDLVREQDFILRVRRMQRLSTPHLVLNIVLNAIEPLAHNATALDAAHAKLRQLAQASMGDGFDMSNGDMFLVWENTPNAHHAAEQVVTAMMTDPAMDRSKVVRSYELPKDYAALRERTNHYIEVVRAAAVASAEQGTTVDAAPGQLSAHSVDQIERVLSEIDLRSYGRTQTIYRCDGENWHAIGEEYFISLEDLRRERFPKLDWLATDHFFMALCGMIDHKLLGIMARHIDLVRGRTLNLNVSVASIMQSVFTQFIHQIPRAERNRMGIEIHRGDLLQDFGLTLSAIEALRREGFRVALDSITPDMVNYVDLAAFNVDTIKLNVSKDRLLQLDDPAIQNGLRRLPPDNLVFFRCDNERALAVGKELGVTQFQGWLIDDLAGRK